MASVVRFSSRTRAQDQLTTMRDLVGLQGVEIEQIMSGMYRVTCAPQHMRDFLRNRGYVSTDVEVWSTTAV